MAAEWWARISAAALVWAAAAEEISISSVNLVDGELRATVQYEFDSDEIAKGSRVVIRLRTDEKQGGTRQVIGEQIVFPLDSTQLSTAGTLTTAGLTGATFSKVKTGVVYNVLAYTTSADKQLVPQNKHESDQRLVVAIRFRTAGPTGAPTPLESLFMGLGAPTSEPVTTAAVAAPSLASIDVPGVADESGLAVHNFKVLYRVLNSVGEATNGGLKLAVSSIHRIPGSARYVPRDTAASACATSCEATIGCVGFELIPGIFRGVCTLLNAIPATVPTEHSTIFTYQACSTLPARACTEVPETTTPQSTVTVTASLTSTASSTVSPTAGPTDGPTGSGVVFQCGQGLYDRWYLCNGANPFDSVVENKGCLPPEFMCDATKDCPDGDDETPFACGLVTSASSTVPRATVPGTTGFTEARTTTASTQSTVFPPFPCPPGAADHPTRCFGIESLCDRKDIRDTCPVGCGCFRAEPTTKEAVGRTDVSRATTAAPTKQNGPFPCSDGSSGVDKLPTSCARYKREGWCHRTNVNFAWVSDVCEATCKICAAALGPDTGIVSTVDTTAAPTTTTEPVASTEAAEAFLCRASPVSGQCTKRFVDFRNRAELQQLTQLLAEVPKEIHCFEIFSDRAECVLSTECSRNSRVTPCKP